MAAQTLVKRNNCPPPYLRLLSFFLTLFFRNGRTSDDQICSLLLMFVNRKVTKGDIIHLLLLSSSLSLLFFTILLLVTWRCVTLWVRMCSPEPDLSLVRGREKKDYCSHSPLTWKLFSTHQKVIISHCRTWLMAVICIVLSSVSDVFFYIFCWMTFSNFP